MLSHHLPASPGIVLVVCKELHERRNRGISSVNIKIIMFDGRQ